MKEVKDFHKQVRVAQAILNFREPVKSKPGALKTKLITGVKRASSSLSEILPKKVKNDEGQISW